jgi:uncharacterized protein YqgV (UPF0045/DUF77 family)|tara:strand:- start:39581 stop:41200 length:1620 start_codon:yes stop_codon:yes gene_type:complete
MSNCKCAPGKAICRSCLNKQAKPYIGNPVNGRGEFTTSQIESFRKQFEGTIESDANLNPLSSMVKKHGGETFYDTVNKINNDFLKRETTTKLLSENLDTYEVLNFRIAKGPLTALEVASFFESANYTPATAIASSNANGSRFLEELDNYYNGDFSTSILGGFCGLFNNIFAAINGFFDLLDTIEGVVNDVMALIEKIKNIEDPIKALFEKIKVKALLEAIKKKVKDMIEKVIKSVCMSISNFDVEAITGPIETPVQKKVVAEAEDKKTALQQVCGKDEAKRIVDKLDSLIDYAVSLFENPSIEEIMFLISRICALATGIEGLLNGLKDPLKDFSNRYDEVFNTLSNASNRITGEAIRAGAIRLSAEARREQINNAREQFTLAGNFKPISVFEYRDLPKWAALKDGSDTRMKIEGDWVTDMKPAREGWEMINIDLRVMLLRLYKEAKDEGIIKGPLIIKEGWTSVQYNDKIKGDKSIQYLNGNAVSITWAGYSPKNDAEDFRSLAIKEGFRGIGLNDKSIHLDVGRKKLWDNRSEDNRSE